MATGSRTLWKGAISFGLVHIPVGLHTASSEQGVDFDWLDKRSMDPVGYKRINKRTGKEISGENIVKGIKYEDGKYVVISPDEIESVFPKTTQTIEIERFIDADAMPFIFLERPYYVAPTNKSEKAYALLRETLIDTGKIALARVVISTKQHLAALLPLGPGLVLNLLRWGDEIKTMDGLDLPPAGRSQIGEAQMKVARQLVKEMSDDWKPEDFKDEFRHQVMKLVDQKVAAGDTETVLQPQEEAPQASNVVDLTALLRQSLQGGRKAAGKAASSAQAGQEPAAKKSAANRSASTPATTKGGARKGATTTRGSRKTAEKSAAGKTTASKAATRKASNPKKAA